MTPAPAPVPDDPAETAVVPVTAVSATVVVEPPLEPDATSMEYYQYPASISGKGIGERAQKLFPTLMILLGSTGGLAAAQTTVEQSRTPKPKSSFLQRHA